MSDEIFEDLGLLAPDIHLGIGSGTHAEQTGFNELKISGRHAAQVNQLPLYHRDPFDRLLVGQALVELMQLLTTDGLLRRYSKEALFHFFK